MRLFISITFLLCLFISCKTKTGSNTYDPDIEDIIYRCLHETLGSKDSARYYYKLIPVIGDNTYRAIAEHYNDSIQKVLNKAAVYLILPDTLGLIGSGDREDMEAFVKLNLPDPQKSFLTVTQSYLMPAPQTINLSAIETRLQIPLSRYEKKNTPEILIGGCRFSNVIFDTKKTNAVVSLIYFSTPRKSGYGELFLLSKTAKGWMIRKRQRTWVS